MQRGGKRFSCQDASVIDTQEGEKWENALLILFHFGLYAVGLSCLVSYSLEYLLFPAVLSSTALPHFPKNFISSNAFQLALFIAGAWRLRRLK